MIAIESNLIGIFFTDFKDVAIYRPTRKGGIKLRHKNYEYFATNSKVNGDLVWRCANFTGVKTEKCLVRAYTRKFGLVDKVRVNGEHMHPPKKLKMKYTVQN